MFNSVVHGMGRLLAYFYDLIPNYGIGIIMLTVLVRVAMIPLAIKQAHIMEGNRANAEKMRKLLPEVKKIKEKFRDDKTKQYEEQKKLYDQHGVNMLGGLSGCLPMIVQMPVFMAMYSVLSGCNKLFGSGRVCELGFHMPDGSALKQAIGQGRDTFLGMNLNFRPSEVLSNGGLVTALPYYLLVAVMGYTMWYQTRQMMKAQPVVDPQMAQTQKIMQFMPLLLVFASLNFPAGLTVYWSATNIWAIAQQAVLIRKVGPLSKINGASLEAEPKTGGLVSRLKAAAQEGRAEVANGKAGAGKTSDGGADKKPSSTNTAGKRPGTNAPAKTNTPGKRPTTTRPAAQKPEDTSAKKPAAAAQRRPAPKPAGKPAAKPAGKPAAQGARKPAASRARTAPQSRSTGAAKPAAAKRDVATSASPEDSGAATGAGPAGRPKGSGARKKNRGGHR